MVAEDISWIAVTGGIRGAVHIAISTVATVERSLVQVALLMIGLVAPMACAAQVTRALVKSNAHELLSSFEQQAQNGTAAIPDIIDHPEDYPRARLDSVVSGLERLALRNDLDEDIKWQAVAALATAASNKQATPGLFERVIRLFETSKVRIVRSSVIHYITRGKDKAPGIEFLKSIVTKPAAPDFEDGPYLAAQELSFTGAEGRAVLTELSTKGAIGDSHARSYTRWFLAKQ